MQDSPTEGIAAIIPTVNRPDLVVRAVRSALDQTCPPDEVIVVQDGDIVGALDGVRGILDPRIKIVTTGSASNDAGATARNLGVRTAASRWIAFLDDDDEWLPHKLEVQMAALHSCEDQDLVVVSGQVERRTQDGSTVWPVRGINEHERLADYLFVRNVAGEGWMPTPTLLTNRLLAESISFEQGLKQHEDHDWLLRLEHAGVKFVVVEQVIAIVHVVDSASLSARATWPDSLAWASARKEVLGPRAFSAFCLTEVSRQAKKDPGLGVFFRVLWTALSGRPRIRDLAQYIATWSIPPAIQTWLRRQRESRSRTHGNRAQ